MPLLLAALAFLTTPFAPSTERSERPTFTQTDESGDCCYSCSYCCGYVGCGSVIRSLLEANGTPPGGGELVLELVLVVAVSTPSVLVS